MSSSGKASLTKTIYANVFTTGNLFKLYGKNAITHARRQEWRKRVKQLLIVLNFHLPRRERDVIILMKTNLYYYRDASGYVAF